MVQRWKVMFPALNGPDERTAYLYLPESYEYEPERRYPVLYMFDGHNLFFDSDATYGKCWGLKEYLDYTNTQVIVAAVECSHDPDNGRLKEYAPYSFSEPAIGTIEGHGKHTMEWWIHTFKSEIDGRFRTLPDREHTYIAGSSMGGLMSVYALLKYNSVFSRAAALSPSLWTNMPALEKLVQTVKVLPDTVLYMDYGSDEIRRYPGMRSQFAHLSQLLLQRNVFLTGRMIPHGTHCEASWEKQLPFMMHTLLYEP